MAIEVFNRVEKKFLMDELIIDKFIRDISPHIMMDEYCKNNRFYTINNIYYDTDNDALIRKSIEKPVYKEKLRLRSYGVPKLDSEVFLEIKKKYNGVVNKRRVILTLQQAYDFTVNGIKPQGKDFISSQVIEELDYFIRFYKPLPKLFLSYDRVAMFGAENRDLRITFDRYIRTRRNKLRLEEGDFGELLIPENKILMEIKSSDSIPLWLTRILTKYEIRQTSFSKYGTEYTKLIKNNIMEHSC